MHPAFSVILFTTASGIGYGLMIFLGLLVGTPALPEDGWFGVVALALSLALVTLGILSSTLHLGHPERAWRAFSQWRTSWLSREGVLAVVTYGPALAFTASWLFFGYDATITRALGITTAVLAAATVGCTAMIYASLRTIHQWHNIWVLPSYLALALFSGSLWLLVLLHFWAPPPPMLVLAVIAVGLLAAGVKIGYWRFITRSASPSTAETATGLGHFGRVRLLDAPHTESNYLQREMGFQIARKHALRLRRSVLAAGFAAPLLLSAMTLSVGSVAAIFLAVTAAVSACLGVFIERWLFFAEAKHTVTLYYGAATA